MNYEENLQEAAKQFLLVYFSDGKERTPSDFDEEIIGGLDASIFTTGRPRWNNTPFFKAIGDLIDDGVIKYWKTDEGAYYYQLNK